MNNYYEFILIGIIIGNNFNECDAAQLVDAIEVNKDVLSYSFFGNWYYTNQKV